MPLTDHARWAAFLEENAGSWRVVAYGEVSSEPDHDEPVSGRHFAIDGDTPGIRFNVRNIPQADNSGLIPGFDELIGDALDRSD